MARRRTVLSALQVVTSAEELDLPLDVDAFAPPLSSFSLGRVRSSLLGVAVAAWLVGVTGVVEVVADPSEVVRIAVVAVSFLVVGAALWRFGTLRDDGRLVPLVGGLLVVVAALALPWDVDGAPVHTLLLALGLVLLVQSYLVWAKVQRLAPRHAADRARIAAVLRAPVRASSARAEVTTVRAGGAFRLVRGTVTYLAASGEERTVPLSTLEIVSMLLEEGDEPARDAPCVVWHDEDHEVVLTRLVATTSPTSA